MYRAPDTTLECAACGRAALTPPTLLDPSEGYVNVHFDRQPDPQRGWLDDTRIRFGVNRARICVECGHVMMFVGEKTLPRLKAMLTTLVPIPEE